MKPMNKKLISTTILIAALMNLAVCAVAGETNEPPYGHGTRSGKITVRDSYWVRYGEPRDYLKVNPPSPEKVKAMLAAHPDVQAKIAYVYTVLKTNTFPYVTIGFAPKSETVIVTKTTIAEIDGKEIELEVSLVSEKQIWFTERVTTVTNRVYFGSLDEWKISTNSGFTLPPIYEQVKALTFYSNDFKYQPIPWADLLARESDIPYRSPWGGNDGVAITNNTVTNINTRSE